MRVVDRLALVDRIGRELQGRFTFDDIRRHLTAFGVKAPEGSWSSKWVYTKDALRDADQATIIRIAEELALTSPGSGGRVAAPPKNWRGTKDLRVFISHISRDKDKATRLKECLAPYFVSCFVAHQDIHPTLEWQGEIERALATMDAFVAVLTPGFSQSVWTQQETGWAVARGVSIISLRMGEDPQGFLSRQQALSRGRRNAEGIAAEIARLFADDARTSSRLKEATNAMTEAAIPF